MYSHGLGPGGGGGGGDDDDDDYDMDEDNMTTTTTTILNVVSWTDFVQSHIRDHLSLLTREARSAEVGVLSGHIRRGDN